MKKSPMRGISTYFCFGAWAWPDIEWGNGVIRFVFLCFSGALILDDLNDAIGDLDREGRELYRDKLLEAGRAKKL